MKMLRYLVQINRDPGSDWGASVPDLPGLRGDGQNDRYRIAANRAGD
jgi:hypothetical protein